MRYIKISKFFEKYGFLLLLFSSLMIISLSLLSFAFSFSSQVIGANIYALLQDFWSYLFWISLIGILFILGSVALIIIIFMLNLFLLPNKLKPTIIEPEYEISDSIKEQIAVIIPAYNEEKTISEAIKAVQPYASKIIVINDGSKDKTQLIAEKFGVYLINHPQNLGLAEALKSGIKKALELDVKVIVNFDADLQYDAKDIIKLSIPVLNNEYDLVMGSRFAGTIEEMPRLKRFGNKLFSKTIGIFTGIPVSDAQTGFRAFSNEFARKIKIRRGLTYTQQMIIEAVEKNFKFAEIPIHFGKRLDGKSRLMKNPIHFAFYAWLLLIRTYMEYKPLKLLKLPISLIFAFGLIFIDFWIISLNSDLTLITHLNPDFLITMGLIFLLFGFTLLVLAFIADSIKENSFFLS